ncbi:hypothetical protein GobsT_56230 [Gemmata obscuriglobus]|uniref:DUF4175 family protein n=1 Tax=Gemmata obscuriglobus TaxID=114 RepID=UPI000A782EF3|nr:DUF4175 family protein [Gemmata obscuriglobus]QEG30810.1 hypothetical protein GobsT_56230 [Gemmata obscuriglobus]VTS10141.1 Uncharacterized protein OS=Singulisphaera acidiphila (strain ATCC BAA-1392 / DSM 18658 / VKM B-2454 / MOB10) GN=Sinac_0402 PE=4 SV=1 [Gemmata obscuriglobus UQM 2246]
MNANTELWAVLDRIGARFRRVRLLGGLAACWAVLALLGLAAGARLAADGSAAGTGRLLALALATAAVVVGAAWWAASRRAAPDRLWVARRIEAQHPDLSALLLAAVDQHPGPDGRFSFLQATVLESAVEHSRAHDWDEAVPPRRLTLTRVAHGLALAGLVVVVGWLGFRTAATAGDNAGAPVAGETFGAGAKVEVEPGHTEIERGSALVVTARFRGPVPADVTFVTEGATPALAPRAMQRQLDDPTFAAYVPSVTADLTYRVEFTGGRSDDFRVKVFEHPELRKVNAGLVFPNYTALEPKTIDDVRHVTAVEGTEITLYCHLSKAVTRAVLVDKQKQEQPLIPHDIERHVYKITLTPTASERYQVQLADADGRANKLPADITINVTRNMPPVVTVPQPGRDARVSPLEELPLKADLRDDFGVVRHGLTVTAVGQSPQEVVLGEGAGKAAPKRVQPTHLIDFEKLKAQPDQVVSYYFWAEDIGPDGKPRRTSGDMYFAEVRHFEEIFRQGEQQTAEQQERERQEREQQGQQGGNAEAADQLAEMQKQIVNATWRLIRREVSITPTDKFAPDVKLLGESQQAVIDRAGALSERLQGESAEHLGRAVKLMEEAKKRLGESADQNAPGTLPAALASEQAAYQALLKLRAREFDVTRNNSRQQRQSGSSANSSRSPSQRQLQQLDLADERQRYETQSAAREQRNQQAQRDREQRENQELADRLKELARRQTDLTDRVKELQSALEQARDQKQKEELQQQLKKLRDQQQQVLRDTDQLQERLEQEQNRDRLAGAREQVEQSREAVRQASEALERGQLGQAVNEGTRAQRQLDATREQLRRETAARFGEEMRDLRQQARKLDDEQQKLTKQLDELKQSPKPGLNSGTDREQVQKGLEEQKKQLDQITDRVQKVVQEAEKSEPQLAQELYNTARTAAEQKVGYSLDLARRLAAGGLPEAADASRKAAEGTAQLRKGIEKASEAVVGDQTDALRRAQRELNDLSDQVNREVAQATGRPQPGQNQNQPGQNQPGQNQPAAAGKEPGQNQPGQGQPAQGQPGQNQPAPGQGQPAQGQPGRNQPGQGNQPDQNQPGQGQPGQGQQGQPGQGNAPGRNQPGQNQTGQGQPGQAQPGQGQNQPGQGNQPGQNQPGTPNPRRLTDPSGQPGGRPQLGGREQGEPGGTGGGAAGGPIREEGFREWYDRMRATEELIDDPQLRAEAARIRERVRSAREEFKRHSKEPDWGLFQKTVAQPLNELRDRVGEELRRRESPNALVPIDRDPVPPEFADGVRRYYERLGSGK